MDTIELYLTILTIICLMWGAYHDIKDRLIPDKVWVVQIVGASPALVVWFSQNTEFLPRLLVATNIILGVICAFIFLFTGTLGGADGKALIAISISSPFTYSTSVSLSLMPPIFLFLANFLLSMILFALILMIINFSSIKKLGPLFQETSGSLGSKIAVLISSRRMEKSKIEHLNHEDPAETYDDNGWKLFTPIFSKSMTDEEFEILEMQKREEAWINIRDSDRTYMWTRPQPPGLVFFSIAYLMLFLIGSPLDLIY